MASRLDRAIEGLRTRLSAMDRDAHRELGEAYTVAWHRIRMEMDSLLKQWRNDQEVVRKAGGELSPDEARLWAIRTGRLEQLQAQVEGALREFARVTGERVRLQQGTARFEGDASAVEMMEALTVEAGLAGGSGVGISFAETPAEAIVQMVGAFEQTSPLRSLLERLPGQTWTHVRERLLAGLSAGIHLNTVGKEIHETTGMALARARTIARTETMRAHREAARLRYAANPDVVGEWMWHAGLGPRVCAACVAMHGTKHPLTEKLDDHPNGRCVMVPLAVGYVPEVEDGQEWLSGQDEDVQRSVLGSEAARLAWSTGAVNLRQFVGRRDSPKWGTMRYRKSLLGILGEKRALTYWMEARS